MTHLAARGELVAEVKYRVWQAGVERVLQIDVVSLDDAVGILGTPPQQHPRQVVLDHRDHGVRDHALLRRQRCV